MAIIQIAQGINTVSLASTKPGFYSFAPVSGLCGVVKPAGNPYLGT